MLDCATGQLQARRREGRAVDATLKSRTTSQFSRGEVEKSVVEWSGGFGEESRKSGGGSRVKRKGSRSPVVTCLLINQKWSWPWRGVEYSELIGHFRHWQQPCVAQLVTLLAFQLTNTRGRP